MNLKRLIVIPALLFSTLACVTLLGTKTPGAESPATAESEAPAGLTEVPATEEAPALEGVTCPVITDQIIAVNSPEQSETKLSDYRAPSEDSETYLVTYMVSGDDIIRPSFEDVPADLVNAQQDTEAHQRIWKYYASLIPAEYRADLQEFSIMTDGQDEILAAVAQTYTDPYKWGLEVDIADSQDYYYFTFTLVHEFAHLLTLGPQQVPPSQAIFDNPEDNDIYNNEVAACPNFFPGEGCSNTDSYINAFYNQFWADIYDEWNEINLEENDDRYYEKLDGFYYKYEDQFLTDYAVTHPAEDIAESFAFFVYSPKPAGDTIAEQKILFFYNYPELVTLRDHILSNTCTSFPQ